MIEIFVALGSFAEIVAYVLAALLYLAIGGYAFVAAMVQRDNTRRAVIVGMLWPLWFFHLISDAFWRRL